MIFVGTDIIEVKRLRETLEKNGSRFVGKIFTPEEIAYCSGKAEQAMHYAGRFAAKEAVKKSLLSYDSKKLIPLKNICINRRDDGAPIVKIQNSDHTVQISISHTRDYATAVAVLEIK